MSFLKANSYKTGIAASIVLNVLSKGLLFCVNLLIAFYFGVSSETDTYFYSYNVAFLISIFFSQLNASVLIPESMRIRVENGERMSLEFLNFFIYGYLLVTLLIALLFIISPVETFMLISNFDEKILERNYRILSVMALLIPLMVLTNILTDILMSYKFFITPMIVGVVNGVIAIVFLISLHAYLDIFSLLTALIISYTINIVLLLGLMVKKLNWSFSFSSRMVSRRIWWNVGFAQMGNITSVVSSYIPFFLLSGFPAGVISSLSFATQVSQIPNTFITNHFSSVAGIKFNELYSKKELSGLNSTFIITVNFLIFILIPISGLFYIYPDEIISFIFKRGNFDQEGVQNTSLFLKYLGLQLPLLAVNAFVARLFMASHKILQGFWYQIAINAILCVAIFIGVSYFGILGYPLALVFTYFLNLLLICFIIQGLFNYINYRKILTHFFYLSIIAIVFLYLVESVIDLFKIESILKFLIGSTLFLLLFLASNFVFKINRTINEYLAKLYNILFQNDRNIK